MPHKKVNFKMHVPDRKGTTGINAKLFLFGCVNSAALPLVRCYSIHLPQGVASWVDYRGQRNESYPVSTTSVISAGWKLIHYDVKISSARIRTHDLWMQKRVCYPLHHSAPSPSLCPPIRCSESWLIDWLINWCLTARQHRKVNMCQLRGGKPAQAAKDSQRDTMHDTLCHTITK